MDGDNFTDVGHQGFLVDAQAMTALLFDVAANPDYRAAVKREFEGIRALFAEYLGELEKTYTVPQVAEPTAK